MAAKKVKFDTLRSLAFGGISAVYAPIGAAFTVEPRLICITNNTDGDLIVSDDNTVVAGKLFLAKGSFKLFDLTSNIIPGKDDAFCMAIGTIMYAKQVTAPGVGSIYIELIYA